MAFKKLIAWPCFVALLTLLAYGNGMAATHTHALSYNVTYSDKENPSTQNSAPSFFIFDLIISDSRFEILDLNDQIFEGNINYQVRQQVNVPALNNINGRSIPGGASVDHLALKSVIDGHDFYFIDKVTFSHFDCMYNKQLSLASTPLNNHKS